MAGRDARGLSESVQLAVLIPVLMLVSLGVLQAGLWLHARNVAQRATTAAVDVARGSRGTTGDARERALALARAGGLSSVDVQVRRTATTATVTLRAEPVTLLDLGFDPVSATASAPVERATVP